MIKEGNWDPDEDVDKLWNEMTGCIKRVAKEVLGEYKGCGWLTKEICTAFNSTSRCRVCIIHSPSSPPPLSPSPSPYPHLQKKIHSTKGTRFGHYFLNLHFEWWSLEGRFKYQMFMFETARNATFNLKVIDEQDLDILLSNLRNLRYS